MATLVAPPSGDSEIHRGEVQNVSSLEQQLFASRHEALLIRQQIQLRQLESQQLRLRLKAAGIFQASFVPALLQAGAGSPLEAARFEMQQLLQWLVDTVDLSQQLIFECGQNEGEVLVGGRHVLLARMAMWPLAVTNLKLSVPCELQADIAQLFIESRARGKLDPAAVSAFSEAWDILGAEVHSAAGRDPAIFLVHRTTNQAVVVAQWPSVEMHGRPTKPPAFDPEKHFGRLFAEAEVSEKHCEKKFAPHSETDPRLSRGDRVEVEYQGRWFAGVLQWVDGDVANVKCDVDSPGVMTVAPLTNVRLAGGKAMAKFPRHFRARSVG